MGRLGLVEGVRRVGRAGGGRAAVAQLLSDSFLDGAVHSCCACVRGSIIVCWVSLQQNGAVYYDGLQCSALAQGRFQTRFYDAWDVPVSGRMFPIVLCNGFPPFAYKVLAKVLCLFEDLISI